MADERDPWVDEIFDELDPLGGLGGVRPQSLAPEMRLKLARIASLQTLLLCVIGAVATVGIVWMVMRGSSPGKASTVVPNSMVINMSPLVRPNGPGVPVTPPVNSEPVTSTVPATEGKSEYFGDPLTSYEQVVASLGPMERWTVDAGTEDILPLAPTPDGGVVCVTERGQVSRFSPTGELTWNYTLPGEPGDWAPAVDNYGGITVSVMGSVVRLGLNGEQEWSYHTGGGIGGAPAVTQDGTTYVTMGERDTTGNDRFGRLFRLDRSGSVEWTMDQASPLCQLALSHHPALMEERLLGLAQENYNDPVSAVAVSPQGATLWTAAVGAVREWPPVSAVGGRVLLVGGAATGSNRGTTLYCLREEDGRVEWTFVPGENILQAPVTSGSYVYLRAGGYDVYRLGLKGGVSWHKRTKKSINSIAIDGHGYLCLDCGEELWVVGTQGSVDGATLFKLPLGDPPRTGQPRLSLTPQGWGYIVQQGGRIMAFNLHPDVQGAPRAR